MDKRSLWATVYGVAKCQTERLKHSVTGSRLNSEIQAMPWLRLIASFMV